MEWTPTLVIALVFLLLVAAGAFTVGLFRAGGHAAPAMLVVSLSLLTMAALIGGLVWDSDSALALAGAGIGALAGAVSSTFTSPLHRRCEEDVEQKDEDNG